LLEQIEAMKYCRAKSKEWLQRPLATGDYEAEHPELDREEVLE
jgi:hypothetical protein